MPTTATQLDNHRSWATHYDKNPKWPSERKAEEEQQTRKSVLAQIKAARAKRATTVAAAQSAYINNVKVGQASSSDTDTASASSSRSSASAARRLTPSSASSSPSRVSTRELQVARASTARSKAANKLPAAALAGRVLPTKPLPSTTPLESMFDDEKDLEHVHGAEEKKRDIETSNKASSSPSKKRKLPFGDDNSEGESDFEDLQRPKKPKTSTVDLVTEKYKDKKGAVKKVCQPQPRWQTLQSSSTARPRSVVQRAKIWRPSSNFRPVSSFFGSHGQTRALQGANQASLQPSAR